MKAGGQGKKGATKERLFCKMLREGYNGWPPCLWAGRSAGSHGALDVTAWWPDVVRGFQLKSGSGRLDDEEVVFLTGLARSTAGLSEVYGVCWEDFRAPVLRRFP